MEGSQASLSPLVIDLIILAIILLTAFIRSRVGLYHIVMSVVVVILSIAAGFAVSSAFSGTAGEYIWEKLEPEFQQHFDDSVNDALNKDESFLSSLAQSLMGGSEDGQGEGSGDIDYSDTVLVSKLRTVTMMKARLGVKKAVKAAVFILSGALAWAVLTLIKRLTGRMIRVSKAGKLDRIGGFLLGIIEACVMLLVIIRGACFFDIGFFRDMSEDTLILKWFIGGDLQSAINALKSLTAEDIKNIDLEKFKDLDAGAIADRIKDFAAGAGE